MVRHCRSSSQRKALDGFLANLVMRDLPCWGTLFERDWPHRPVGSTLRHSSQVLRAPHDFV
jgi:hypothetical protein